MPHLPVRARAAFALLATAALTTTLLASVTTTATADDSGAKSAAAPARTESRGESRALTAVGEARSIVAGTQRGDLTMALREVANTRDSLSGADRAAADDLLARPNASGGDGTLNYGGVSEETPRCSADICVHYVASGVNAVSPTDANLNGRPDYVEVVLSTLTHVHDAYLTAGYREPKADGTRGGNSKIDVYLGELGSRGLYGYCTSDDPTRSTKFWDRWAYCALDNDYAEFPTNTPVENLQVTVAHEYFHATQYAYDRYEDAWLLEATATWVEDEMYDAVNDNLQYLRRSPMTMPRTPLDTFNPNTGFHYGTWSFFRFLSEKYSTKKGRLPRIVLDVWRKADGSLGKRDEYSWQAVNSVLRKKRTTGAAMLGAYAVANRRPAKRYSEGRVNHYPTAPTTGSSAVTRRRGVRASFKLNHLTTATTKMTPQGLSAAGWKLRLTFDLPPLGRDSSALVTSTSKTGKVTTRRVRLNRQGDAVTRVPFSSRTVSGVEVTVVNGGGHFRCFVEGGNYSCSGAPLDNGLRMRFTAFAVR